MQNTNPPKVNTWANLGVLATWCKRALLVESQATKEKSQESDRVPLDLRLQGGSAVGPIVFKEIVAYDKRTGAITKPGNLSDGRAGSPKGSTLCYKYVSTYGALDTGKLKPGDKADVIGVTNHLLEQSGPRSKAEIVDITNNHILVAIAGQKAYPPTKVNPKTYLLSKEDDLNLAFHSALKLCPEWPVVNPNPPQILPCLPFDSKVFIQGEDAATTKAFLLSISGNDICGVQGPPGTGKTMLLGKVAAYYISKGINVGIVSLSHNAVINALNATQAELDKHRINKKIYKYGDQLQGLNPKIEQMNKDHQSPCCIGATIHAAARFYGQATNKINLGSDGTFQNRKRDIILVDEAGQAPAYIVLALSFLAPRMILFGDQAQLPPIIQGAHPIDNITACSAMEFLVRHRSQAWVTPLLTSHRMNKDICKLIREFAYPNLDLIAGKNKDLKFCPNSKSSVDSESITIIDVPHRHRATKSIEEINAVYNTCCDLLKGTLSNGKQITPEDIVVLTPFRCQKRGLTTKLANLGITRIGTVHSMQGQGAPIVLFSMTVSSEIALSHLAEWLFDPANWNVLISRAQAKIIIFASLEALRKFKAAKLKGLQYKQRIVKHILEKYARKNNEAV